MKIFHNKTPTSPPCAGTFSLPPSFPLFSSPHFLFLCIFDFDKESVSGFERLSGLTVLKNWDSSVTHIIASTDENGACRRTLKVLMGILEGKWILSVECEFYCFRFNCSSSSAWTLQL
ncbi:hypothetical protein DVH24_017178 [Malus domestica]|uniref:BRCT domain-containing protein n=1 Tax=Malus domestica TaxID=3750 RepID=A0A498IV58_MALDO|nr:hypothetical protein DVH24_017178 [Malus domestica]